MSPELRAELEAYYEWAIKNKDRSFPCKRMENTIRPKQAREGLCAVVEKCLYEELANLLLTTVGTCALPFNWPIYETYYTTASFNGTHHQNPHRLAWVRKVLDS